MVKKNSVVSWDKLLNVLFFALVVLNNTFGSDPTLYVVSKYVMLVFMVCSIIKLISKRKISIDQDLLVPSLFALLEIASIIWSQNRSVALSQLITQLQLYVLFLTSYYFIKIDERRVHIFLQATYVSGYSLAIYAIYKYGFSGFFVLMRSGIRMGGLITNQNTFGIVFSTAAIVSFYLMLMKDNKKYLVSIVIFAFFALSSGSKKATLMLVIGIILISMMYYGIKRIWKTLLIICAIAIAAYYLLRLPLFATIYERLEEFFTGDLNVSDLNRKRFNEIGMSLFWKRPLFGYGLNNYATVTGIGTYSHNNFIELLVGLGLTGLVLYYYPYIVSLIRLIKHSTEKDVTNIIISVLLVISVVFGYGMVQFYEKDTWIMGAVCLGYSVNKLLKVR